MDSVRPYVHISVDTSPAWKPERRFDGEWERIELEAARWLVLIDGQPSASDLDGLDAWLAARARHQAAFLRLSIAWRKADRLRVQRND